MWTYQEFTGSQVELSTQLQNFLNTRDKDESVHAKIASADVRTAAARTVVFWNTDVPSTPLPLPIGTIWTHETYSTTGPTTCWYECIYRKIADKLNSLTMQQSCYAKICFTDAEGYPASISIYWLD